MGMAHVFFPVGLWTVPADPDGLTVYVEEREDFIGDAILRYFCLRILWSRPCLPQQWIQGLRRRLLHRVARETVSLEVLTIDADEVLVILISETLPRSWRC